MNTPFERSLRGHLTSVDEASVPSVDAVLAGAGRAAERQARHRRRAAIGGVVALVALAGAGLTMSPFDSPAADTLPVGTAAGSTVVTTTPSPTTLAPPATLDPTLTPAPGWTAVPPDPRGVTRDADVVWTGSVALMIGGVDDNGQARDGVASYDPTTRSWQVLSTEPVPLMFPLFAWAGSQLLAIGWDAFALNTFVATFDPATGEWSRGPQAPVGVKVTPQLPWVWTGSELMIVTNQGTLAYDVPGEQWRVLAPSPLIYRIDATSVWTGQEWIVWGGDDFDSPKPLADGAAYDPVADRWRVLSESPLGPRLTAGVWTGAEVVIVGGRSGNSNGMMAYGDGAAYDPATDTWRSLTPGPAHPGFVPVWSGELLMGFFKQGVSIYDPGSNAWVSESAGSGEFAGSGLSHLDRSPVWTGSAVLLLGSYDIRIGGAVFTPAPTE